MVECSQISPLPLNAEPFLAQCGDLRTGRGHFPARRGFVGALRTELTGGTLRQRQSFRFGDCGKTRSRVMRDMRVERRRLRSAKTRKSPPLRRLDHAEARLAAGNGEIEVRLGGDPQEDTGVRHAFAGLSG